MFSSESINNGTGPAIKCSHKVGTTLELLSDKAKSAFLKTIESQYCDGMDIESWYGLQVNLANPNS